MSENGLNRLSGERILHTVAFRLRYAMDAPETQVFLHDAERILTGIPQVENFQVLREVSEKNDFDFGFSMEFENQAAYDAYNNHPTHQAFVTQRWLKEVADFMEVDYKGTD